MPLQPASSGSTHLERRQSARQVELAVELSDRSLRLLAGRVRDERTAPGLAGHTVLEDNTVLYHADLRQKRRMGA